MSAIEKKLLERLRDLPRGQQARILRLVEAVAEGADPEDVEFDLWARLLARRKGFDRLTEEDAVRAVRTHRGR